MGAKPLRPRTLKAGTRVRIIGAREGDEFLVTTRLNSRHSWGNFFVVKAADVEVEKEVKS